MKANARGITLASVGSRGLSVLGDEDLLVTALRNLLETVGPPETHRTAGPVARPGHCDVE